jgi:hypothetical protein
MPADGRWYLTRLLKHKAITILVSRQQTTKRPCDATFLHSF